MPQSETKKTTDGLEAAFTALRSYDYGSSRAKLLPLDEAVAASLADSAARKALEQRLLRMLNGGCPTVAREYICSKLALIGSDVCVPSLLAILAQPELSTAARNVLETIPGRTVGKALRKSLPKLNGLQKAGAITSLGIRRDAGSVRVLSALLGDADPTIGAAAWAALGEIGSARAASALRKELPKVKESLRDKAMDACLVCAEKLLGDGKKSDAKTLYQAVAVGAPSRHVHLAVTRGLERIARVSSR